MLQSQKVVQKVGGEWNTLFKATGDHKLYFKSMWEDDLRQIHIKRIKKKHFVTKN